MTAWTDHIKAVAKKEKISYKEAMKIASKTFKKSEPKKGQPSKSMPGLEDFTTKKGMKRSTARRAFEK